MSHESSPCSSLSDDSCLLGRGFFSSPAREKHRIVSMLCADGYSAASGSSLFSCLVEIDLMILLPDNSKGQHLLPCLQNTTDTILSLAGLNTCRRRLRSSLFPGINNASHLVCSVAQIRSVAQSCPTLCDPMHRSTPGLPVHHQLPEFTQTHIHRVSDAIQPSHALLSPSPLAPNPSQHQSLFQ